MNISLEISMYPLTEEYLAAIDRFLEQLHQQPGLKIRVNQMSTQVFGPSEKVFKALQSGIESSYAGEGQFPFVIKVLKGDVSENPLKDYPQ